MDKPAQDYTAVDEHHTDLVERRHQAAGEKSATGGHRSTAEGRRTTVERSIVSTVEIAEAGLILRRVDVLLIDHVTVQQCTST